MAGMKSSAPTISVSVELRVLSFCLVELTMGKPRPRDSPPPECPRMLGCTANYASTHHFRIPPPFALRTSGIVRVHLMYLIKWTNLFKLSLSGDHTLVVRKVIAVQVSGLDRLVKYHILVLLELFTIFIHFENTVRCCTCLSATTLWFCLVEGS
jgi:hypothetical protein